MSDDIKSKPATAGYRDNHDVTFGPDVPRAQGRRRRWVYVDGQPFEVDDSWEPTERTVPVVTDRYMEGARATDGTDIGSRSKRKAFMKERNLVDADDCKGMWDAAEKRRAAFKQGHNPDAAEIRDAVGRATWELKDRRR